MGPWRRVMKLAEYFQPSSPSCHQGDLGWRSTRWRYTLNRRVCVYVCARVCLWVSICVFAGYVHKRSIKSARKWERDRWCACVCEKKRQSAPIPVCVSMFACLISAGGTEITARSRFPVLGLCLVWYSILSSYYILLLFPLPKHKELYNSMHSHMFLPCFTGGQDSGLWHLLHHACTHIYDCFSPNVKKKIKSSIAFRFYQ